MIKSFNQKIDSKARKRSETIVKSGPYLVHIRFPLQRKVILQEWSAFACTVRAVLDFGTSIFLLISEVNNSDEDSISTQIHQWQSLISNVFRCIYTSNSACRPPRPRRARWSDVERRDLRGLSRHHLPRLPEFRRETASAIKVLLLDCLKSFLFSFILQSVKFAFNVYTMANGV